ncbi:hypothetical protein AKJ59_00455 [candidate division MSBL1 archaeon SCGC-AAA385M02]|uniref:Uncharacterized protein n=1 Tax=candidate division MSBL1 archaeon SCGC-AAA385M02 TaxID=1698287 RepID=A0A133VQQ5_9EURY|nr:hypothetical protein AKJ59_00455 [candidate division MSBL1 archaeon SCGC-AAA385M02]
MIYKKPKPPFRILDDLYDKYKFTKDKTEGDVAANLSWDKGFRAFLEKVDAAGMQILIDTLFGSEGEYIDSLGSFWFEREESEYSIFHHYFNNAEHRQLFKLWAWYFDNIGVAMDWTYQKEKCGYCDEVKPFVATWAPPEYGADEKYLRKLVENDTSIIKEKELVPICRKCFYPIADRYGKLKWEHETRNDSCE